MNRQRHAFLLKVHELPDQVQQLVELLDDPRNDLYVMADAKGDVDPTRLVASRAPLVALPRMPIYWAGYSQSVAILRLLERATQAGPYAYYHHISGTDLPLVGMDELHERLRGERREFVEYQPQYFEWAHWKVDYWHPFVETSAYRKHKAVRAASHAVVKAQILSGHTLRGDDARPLRNGSEFFSITHDFAQYLLEHREWIHKTTRRSISGEEVFVQTLLAASGSRFEVAEPVEGQPGNLRHIDWSRPRGNSPHTFRSSDLEELRRVSTTCLFARKFNRTVDPGIVDHIHGALTAGSAI